MKSNLLSLSMELKNTVGTLTIKVALEHFGIMSKHDRMPLLPLGDAESNIIKSLLESLPLSSILGKTNE